MSWHCHHRQGKTICKTPRLLPTYPTIRMVMLLTGSQPREGDVPIDAADCNGGLIGSRT
jgi:hypothetical protein